MPVPPGRFPVPGPRLTRDHDRGPGCPDSGIGIYDAAKNGGTTTIPSARWLAVMVAGTLLAIAVLTAVAAHLGARRPVT